MKTILQLPVAATWDGEQMEPDGAIGLREITLNRTHWEVAKQLHSILIPDGGSLIIRREGKMIYVERP